jgi:catechol 2,3-dioxygenase-like lactoylglutathione lyase family enzyme
VAGHRLKIAIAQGRSVAMGFSIDRIDHVVLNCRDVEATVAWYKRVLGMESEVFGEYRHTALKFGRQKFNVRPTGRADWWSVKNDAPGALDLCFITKQPPDQVVAHLNACGVKIETGPQQQIGALGPMTSVYFHDPDGNLIEVASYRSETEVVKP